MSTIDPATQTTRHSVQFPLTLHFQEYVTHAYWQTGCQRCHSVRAAYRRGVTGKQRTQTPKSLQNLPGVTPVTP